MLLKRVRSKVNKQVGGRECEHGRGVESCEVATWLNSSLYRENCSKQSNLEIIGEYRSYGVRGSFLPVEAIRLPSPVGEQPLGNSEELATHESGTLQRYTFDCIA